MLFVGVDLGWINGATGLAVLEWRADKLRLRSLGLARDHADALRGIHDYVGDGPALIAIDAPTIIHNAGGQRPGEKLLNAAFRRYGLGCHAANLARPFAHKTVAFSTSLECCGFSHADTIAARHPGRYQIEVFPHAAIVRLFGLDYRLPYKRGAFRCELTLTSARPNGSFGATS